VKDPAIAPVTAGAVTVNGESPNVLLTLLQAENVGVALPIVRVSVTCVAALKLALPAWLYWITQLPAALKVTTPAAMEQILEDPAAIVIATLNPEDAVAVGVYVPATTGEVGDVEVRVMVWAVVRVTVSVYVVVVEPFTSVTTTRIVFEPLIKANDPDVVPEFIAEDKPAELTFVL
jgi:hypothetical protein